ncbi:MAG: serine protease, partial [Actinomycetota bacterium]|nr:serine protease [Actinomycetota bacterium]
MHVEAKVGRIVALGADARLGRTAALLAFTAVLATVVGVASYVGGREFQQSRVAAGASSTPPADPAQPPAGTPAVLSDESRALARSAAVRLLAPANGPVGSGSIISADGLILTSAHIVAPTAPGLALLYGGVQTLAGVAPDKLVVSVSPGGDGPSTPTFTAEVLAVDGYLDLAVLRIVADAQGRPLPNGTTFPFVPLGSVADV